MVAQQFNEEQIMEYIMDIIEYGLDALALVTVGIWEGFWSFFNAYIGMDNAFWITIMLIAILSVYVIVYRFVLK